MTTLDTVIIGGGQAGLALGHHLQRAGRRFAIVEAADRLGDSWRRRWDSLTLFTPRRYDALPGLQFPGDPEGCPGKDEVADYLESYASRFELPARLASAVTAVRRDGLGGFTVETDTATLETRQVVGAGNTGVQIAEELAAAGRRVTLSVSSLGKGMPERFLGKSLFWWFETLGSMDAGPETRIGRRLRTENTIVGTNLRALFRQVQRAGRVVGADGDQLLMADGSHRGVDAVVWATGFRPSYPWLQVPVLDGAGAPIHVHGITDVPGLTFLGLPWQRNRGSALLGFVGRDAQRLAERLGAQLRSAPPNRTSQRVGVGK